MSWPRAAVQERLPVTVQEIEFNDPLLTIFGQGRSLNLACPWDGTIHPAGLSWEDDDVEDRAWELVGADLIAVVAHHRGYDGVTPAALRLRSSLTGMVQLDLINRHMNGILAVIDHIATPVAIVVVSWLGAEQGGRRSGPPTAPVYAANCTFPLGGEEELIPGWPATAQLYSLLLQKREEFADGTWLCSVDFFARDLVAPYLKRGASMYVMEGPKVVGFATVQDVDPEALFAETDW